MSTTTTSRIHQLPLYTANQIAAGEVVERPSSVIKECVENSIDAGAKKIHVQIEAGGANRIRITDDGCGIHPEDLLLSVSRHATSKIESAEDLHQIQTLGFRGEALASIASVSHFTLTSRCQGFETAWQIEVDEQANCSTPTPAAHPFGTTVDIRGLFYNTPARRKFMRTRRTETLLCQEMIKRLALSHFDIAFQFDIDDKTIYRLPAIEDPKQFHKRIQKIMGKNFIEQSFEVDLHAPGLRLWGWLGQPALTRSQNDGQLFFLNGRTIRDKLINHAMRQVYQEVIYPGRHPLYVLYLECDPREIDVNVHPTKHEVRFHQSRVIHDFITAKLTSIVLNQPNTLQEDAEQSESKADAMQMQAARQPNPAPMPYALSMPSSDNVMSPQVEIKERTVVTTPTHVMQNRYAFFMLSDTIYCVDVLRAYESVIEVLCQSPENLMAQPLLMPERISDPALSVTELEKRSDWLAACGIQFRKVDNTTCLIQSWPKALPCVGLRSCLTSMTSASSAEDCIISLSSIAKHVNVENASSEFWRELWQVLAWSPEGDHARGDCEKFVRRLGVGEIVAWFC